jgi:rhodanese-related sulfurtransferase
MDAIISLINKEKPENALIIGGGYIGLEMAEAFRERGIGVTLVELAPQVLAPVDYEMATLLHQQLKIQGVDLRLETSVTSFVEQENSIGAQLSTGQCIDFGLVIMAIGVKPETKLAKDAGLALGERGGILVSNKMQTNDPDIYAVGDAIEVKDFVGGFNTLLPLAGPANRQGRIAADNVMGRNSEYKGTQGTGICKVFDLAAGMTGMNEKSLKRIGKPYQKIYVHPASHASYYPGASPISLKLLFDPETGKILGAQAVGSDGVDKRIDVLSTAIRAGMTVYDLEELELSYAPPYGSAKDPINYAGFVASNALCGDVDICHTEDMLNPREDQLLLDVRTTVENDLGTIPGSVNIPVQQLRDRISELPKDKELLVFCQVGLRGYLACRILKQKGFRCKNLTGGYKTFTMATDTLAPSALKKEKVTDDSGTNISDPGKKESEPVSIVKMIFNA